MHLQPLSLQNLQVKLKREKLELSPVYSTSLTHDEHKVGYVRLSNFSQKAASDMKRHIKKLEVFPPFLLSPRSLYQKLTGKVILGIQMEGFL